MLWKKNKASETEAEQDSVSMKLSFSYTYDEYLEANAAHWRLRRPIYQALAALLILLGAYLALAKPSHPRGYMVTAVGAVALLVLTRYFDRLLARSWNTSAKYKHLHTVDVSSSQITVAANQKSTIAWGNCVRLLETDNLFLLYERSRPPFFLPKRAFFSADPAGVCSINQFRELAGSKITSPTSRFLRPSSPPVGGE